MTLNYQGAELSLEKGASHFWKTLSPKGDKANTKRDPQRPKTTMKDQLCFWYQKQDKEYQGWIRKIRLCIPTCTNIAIWHLTTNPHPHYLSSVANIRNVIQIRHYCHGSCGHLFWSCLCGALYFLFWSVHWASMTWSYNESCSCSKSESSPSSNRSASRGLRIVHLASFKVATTVLTPNIMACHQHGLSHSSRPILLSIDISSFNIYYRLGWIRGVRGWTGRITSWTGQ